MIERNAKALGVPGLKIVSGEAPAVLTGLPTPDAIFIGGGVNQSLAQTCWDALPPGGRLVANTVTVEGEQALFALQERFGGELCRIEVAMLDRLGGHRAFRAKLPVTQYWLRKP
jgi:precorrin-6Y C5,15-methyltransferase (decarboxylating)